MKPVCNINIIEGKYEEFAISIIHIPPHLDNPHVIRIYRTIDKDGKAKGEENKIFVRRGTQCQTPSKYDLELMYYDRKNIIPEYKVSSSFHFSHIVTPLRPRYSRTMDDSFNIGKFRI